MNISNRTWRLFLFIIWIIGIIALSIVARIIAGEDAPMVAFVFGALWGTIILMQWEQST